MTSILKKITSKVKNKFKWKPKTKNLENLVTIGTHYGQWTIPDRFLDRNSVVYLFGAGEDISFDVGIAQKYNCNVHIFDPTPRAKQHFDHLKKGIKNSVKVPINNDELTTYNLDSDKIDQIKFHEIGVWKQQGNLKFYEPKNREHVSHSIVNIQKTSNYFEAEVDRLSNILKTLGHNHIDLLKLDIEGAEYEVVNSMIEDQIKPNVICIEYDEAYNPLDKDYLTRIRKSVINLEDYGYSIVHDDGYHNYTFVLNEHFFDKG